MTLPTVLDSWWEPDDANIATAKARGYVGWAGYFAEDSNDGVYHGWQNATFERIREAGLQTYAYCSGWDDPAYIKARAASLGIVAILDVETTIRPDGSWVDAWLEESGAALYGNFPVIEAHRTHGHAGYVNAGYPGTDPNLYFPSNGALSPVRPRAWQYTDAIRMPGGPCDGSHFDDTWATIVGGMTPTEEAALLSQVAELHAIFFSPYANEGGTARAPWSGYEILRRQLTDLGARWDEPSTTVNYPPGYVASSPTLWDDVRSIKTSLASIPVSGGLTAAQNALLSDIDARLVRIETALKGA